MLPLTLYIIICVAAIVLVFLAFLLKNTENYSDIVAGFMGTYLSWYVSQHAISGSVSIITTALIGTTDQFATDYEIVTFPALHYFFLLISMISLVYTIFLVFGIIVQTYKNIIDRRYDL